LTASADSVYKNYHSKNETICDNLGIDPSSASRASDFFYICKRAVYPPITENGSI
jgi:hypothetical protein